MHASRRIFLLLLFLGFVLPNLAWAQVDINHADARTLAESLVGVGLVRAEAIIAYRSTHGPFKSIDELVRVHGIGAKTLDANRAAIVIVADEHKIVPAQRH